MNDTGHRCIYTDCPWHGIIYFGQPYGTDDESRTLHLECRKALIKASRT